MLLGLFLSVSCICMLVLSSASGFPASKTGYRNAPQMRSWRSSVGAAPSGRSSPLIFPSGGIFPQGPPAQHSSFAGGNQSPSKGGEAAVAGQNAVGLEKQPVVPPGSQAGSSRASDCGAGACEVDQPDSAAGAGSSSGGAQPEALPWLSSDGIWWMPNGNFPDFSVLESSPEEQQQQQQRASETSPPLPPLPSSYIIQSRSGYRRQREHLSHTKYTPEYEEEQQPLPEPELPSDPQVLAKVPVAQAPAEGGQKGEVGARSFFNHRNRV